MTKTPDVTDYFGLIYKTASLHVGWQVNTFGIVEVEFDDVVQFLSIKVWRAINSYDEARVVNGKGRDSYVFACMTCAVKDLRKRVRRFDSYIEDLAPASSSSPTSAGSTSGVQSRDRFDLEHGLVVDEEQVYGGVEDEALPLPSTLTDLEQRVVCLLVADWRQSEVARELGIERREMDRLMRTIRNKMADWRPGPEVIAEVMHLPIGSALLAA